MNRTARIGGPIVVAVIGAILYFAVAERFEGVDLTMIGLILMIAGGVWLLIELIVNGRNRTIRTERTAVHDPGPGAAPRTTHEVRRDDVP